MSDAWPQCRLQDVTVKIGSGATPRGGKSVYRETGTAFIRSQNVYDNAFSPVGLARITEEAAKSLDNVSVAAGDVLMNITGESVTRTCTVSAAVLPARVSQHVVIIRPDPTLLDSEFLKFSLLEPRAKARLNTLSQAGATRRALTKAHLSAFEIAVPPLAVQQAIASALVTFDRLAQSNETLWMVQTQLAYALLRRCSGTVQLSELANLRPGSAQSPQGATDLYSLPAFDLARLPAAVDGEQVKSGKQLLTEPAVLVSRLNPHIPRVWMARPRPGRVAAASTEWAALHAVACSLEELWAVCSDETFLAQAEALVTGTSTSHQRVPKDALLALSVPDVRTLSQPDRAALTMLVRVAHESHWQNEVLRRRRDELLPLFMSGRALPTKHEGVDPPHDTEVA